MRSKCTGMTGTSNPSTILSIPLLKGRRFPVRLIAPSANMHTNFPCESSARARYIDLRISFRLPSEIGIAFMRVKNHCRTLIL